MPRPTSSDRADHEVSWAESQDDSPDRRDAPVRLSMSEAIGGPRGIVDSALPTLAFVLVNAEAGLSAAIVTAVVVGVGIFVLRLLRREPVQQAFSGLFAVGVAAFVASRTGSSDGFFLPSIAKNAVSIVAGLASLALRRPLAGYVMAGIEPRYAGWRSQPEMLRAASWATLVWIAVFVLRFGIQGVLYLAGESGWLAAANIALGLPLFGVAVLATLAIVRRLAPAARFGPRPGSAAAARIAEPDAPGPDAPGPGLAELDTASADRVQPASPDPEIGS